MAVHKSTVCVCVCVCSLLISDNHSASQLKCRPRLVRHLCSAICLTVSECVGVNVKDNGDDDNSSTVGC